MCVSVCLEVILATERLVTNLETLCTSSSSHREKQDKLAVEKSRDKKFKLLKPHNLLDWRPGLFGRLAGAFDFRCMTLVTFTIAI